MSGSVLLEHLLKGVTELELEAKHQRDLFDDEARASGLEAAAAIVRLRLIELPELTVTYAEAAAMSIWAEGTLRNRVSNGKLENIGTRSEPKVRLRDLHLDGRHLFALPSDLDEA